MKTSIAAILAALLTVAPAFAKSPMKPTAKPASSAKPVSSAKPASAPAKSGGSQHLGQREWQGVKGITTVGNKMYVASGLTLLVSDASGKATDLYPKGAPEFGNPEILSSYDGKLYLLADALFEVDPKDGKQKNLGDGYRYAGGIAGLDGKLFIASDNAMWQVDKNTGKYVKFTDRDWYNVHAMTALDGKLYVFEGMYIVEVDTAGKYKKLPLTLPTGNAMVSANGFLYVFTGDPTPALHKIDKTGKDTPIALPAGWDGTNGIHGMTVLGNKLYLLMTNMGSTVTLFTVDIK